MGRGQSWFETVCDCAEELKLQSPSCCLRPRQIYYHTQDSKRRRHMKALCVCVCVCKGVCSGRSWQKIKRNEASTHTVRMRRKLRLLQIKYFTGQESREEGGGGRGEGEAEGWVVWGLQVELDCNVYQGVMCATAHEIPTH